MNNLDLIATLEYLEDKSSSSAFWFRLVIDNQLPISIWHITLGPDGDIAPARGSVALGGVLAPILLVRGGPMRRGVFPHGFNPPVMVELPAGQKTVMAFSVNWPIQEESIDFKQVSIESGRTIEWYAIVGFMFYECKASQLIGNAPRDLHNQFARLQKTLISNIVQTKVP